ncbi:thioredoxin family protein [Mixta theicola]|uniref:Thioredoxin family protein n=1 Tax=Mixta theicola TaxID=1458355 RepID=A0A2K1QE52_9GAMM|nr:thioredoxin family protein [Mixta theicola]PNS13302.1 thioredoxin family protein [Mixta theicola]GLR09598.1 thioredoxin family protein [Mixta theicola]
MSAFETLFKRGKNTAEFIATGTPEQIADLQRWQAMLESQTEAVEKALAPAQRVAGRFRLLVAAEMWCPDCHRNIPPMALLCQRLANIDMAIITRDEAQPFIDLPGVDRVKIPMAVVLDEAFTPLGTFIERPASVVNGGAEQLEAYRRGELLAETISDISAIIAAAR